MSHAMQRQADKWSEVRHHDFRGFARCLGDEVMLGEVMPDGSTRFHRTSRAAVGLALEAFFRGVEVMLLLWPDCERCDGSGKIVHDRNAAYGSIRTMVDPCPDCGGTGEEPWK